MSVYFIKADSLGLVKIGSAEKPIERYRNLQTGSPVELRLTAFIDGNATEEMALHRRFEDYRRHGEWFFCDGELEEFINSLPQFEKPKRKTRNDLIGALGGSGAVAKATGLNQSTVSMWRERGIAWRYRPMIADMARKAKIELPDGFLDPGLREAA